MARQDKITGDYSIVSVFQNHLSVSHNTAQHWAAVHDLLRAGYTVTQFQGMWDGNSELSIKIEGFVGLEREDTHMAAAEEIAALYGQEAFIVVKNGEAAVWGQDDGLAYTRRDKFTRLLTGDQVGRNYTETAGGFRFGFGS